MKKQRKKTSFTELHFCNEASFNEDDNVANKAMEMLRKRFDSTYFFCNECDGLAVKESECCLNQPDNEDEFSF